MCTLLTINSILFYSICIYDAYTCSGYDDYSMENITKMFDVGLYINDLSMHDSSRDLVLAGTQQSAELKLALDQVCVRTAPNRSPLRRLKIRNGWSVNGRRPFVNNVIIQRA